MRNLKLGSLAYMSELLLHYQRHGHFTKEFIHYRKESGNFLKSVSIEPDSIRVKIKRNFFILFHKNGYLYLVDTISPQDQKEKEEVANLNCNGKNVRAITLFPWSCMPSFLEKLEKHFKDTDKLLMVALNRLSPLVVAKVKDGRSLVRDADGNPVTLVRKSEIGQLANAGLKIKELTNSPDRQVINAKRKS